MNMTPEDELRFAVSFYRGATRALSMLFAIVLTWAVGSLCFGQTSIFALKPGPTSRDVSDTDLKVVK